MGLNFPFEYNQFVESKNDQISIYTKVANEIISIIELIKKSVL